MNLAATETCIPPKTIYHFIHESKSNWNVKIQEIIRFLKFVNIESIYKTRNLYLDRQSWLDAP